MAKIWDAHDALGDVAQFVSGRTFDDYTCDPMLRAAVERKIEIVGEALNQMRSFDPELAERVPRFREIVGLRNVLAHGYAAIIDDRVWQAATLHAPELRAVLAAVLAENE